MYYPDAAGSKSRTSFWKEQYSKLELAEDVNKDELSLLKILANGSTWMDLVSKEWLDIYGAMFDESSCLKAPESEKIKISKDVHRTFAVFENSLSIPALLAFKFRKSKYYRDLEVVLSAISHYHNYCQGMNFIVGSFLFNGFSARESFILMNFLLRQRHMEILYNPKSSSLVDYINLFDKRFRKMLKPLYLHFKEVTYYSFCFAIEWFTTCFTVCCPVDFSNLVFDLIFVGISDIMLRIGLGAMQLLTDELINLNQEELMHTFKSLIRNLCYRDLFYEALRIQLKKGYNYLEVYSKLSLFALLCFVLFICLFVAKFSSFEILN